VATANVSARLGNVLFRQQNRTARHADWSGVTELGLLLFDDSEQTRFLSFAFEMHSFVNKSNNELLSVVGVGAYHGCPFPKQ
jgi:hypothetical protein